MKKQKEIQSKFSLLQQDVWFFSKCCKPCEKTQCAPCKIPQVLTPAKIKTKTIKSNQNLFACSEMSDFFEMLQNTQKNTICGGPWGRWPHGQLNLFIMFGIKSYNFWRLPKSVKKRGTSSKNVRSCREMLYFLKCCKTYNKKKHNLRPSLGPLAPRMGLLASRTAQKICFLKEMCTKTLQFLIWRLPKSMKYRRNKLNPLKMCAPAATC